MGYLQEFEPVFEKLRPLILKGKACVDCGGDGGGFPLLPITIKDKQSRAQCVKCFEIFQSYALGEITIDEVNKFYGERLRHTVINYK
jgi:hypothetical protein